MLLFRLVPDCCLFEGIAKTHSIKPRSRAQSELSHCGKNNAHQLSRILFKPVQYWTAIYSMLADHQCGI